MKALAAFSVSCSYRSQGARKVTELVGWVGDGRLEEEAAALTEATRCPVAHQGPVNRFSRPSILWTWTHPSCPRGDDTNDHDHGHRNPQEQHGNCCRCSLSRTFHRNCSSSAGPPGQGERPPESSHQPGVPAPGTQQPPPPTWRS